MGDGKSLPSPFTALELLLTLTLILCLLPLFVLSGFALFLVLGLILGIFAVVILIGHGAHLAFTGLSVTGRRKSIHKNPNFQEGLVAARMAPQAQ